MSKWQGRRDACCAGGGCTPTSQVRGGPGPGPMRLILIGKMGLTAGRLAGASFCRQCGAGEYSAATGADKGDTQLCEPSVARGARVVTAGVGGRVVGMLAVRDGAVFQRVGCIPS